MNYTATVYRFQEPATQSTSSLEEAVRALYHAKAEAIVLDLVAPREVDDWWMDEGFSTSPYTKNRHHAGIVATAITVGQLQREQGAAFISKIAEYFALASKANAGLWRTRFVRLFADQLGAEALTLGTEYPAEFLLATRREYEPFDAPFNFAPHCDDISYARDVVNWPEKNSDENQLGAFLTVRASANDAGMVMWQHRPKSRRELDELHSEYTLHRSMAALDASHRIALKPQPGQLTIFRSKNMHAIEACSSLRRTMGLFLLKKDTWRIFD